MHNGCCYLSHKWRSTTRRLVIKTIIKFPDVCNRFRTKSWSVLCFFSNCSHISTRLSHSTLFLPYIMLFEFSFDTFTFLNSNSSSREWIHVVVSVDSESLAIRRHCYPLNSRGRYSAGAHLPLSTVRLPDRSPPRGPALVTSQGSSPGEAAYITIDHQPAGERAPQHVPAPPTPPTADNRVRQRRTSLCFH